MILRAQRTKIVPIFAKPPQQSDYTPRWEGAASGAVTENAYTPSRPSLAKLLPGVSRLIHVLKMGLGTYHNQSLRNRAKFAPVPRP